MNSKQDNLVSILGVLRLGLISLVLLDILLPLIEMLVPFAASGNEHTLWSIFSTIIAPVMAPLLFTVLLFSYVISRIRAADAEGDLRARYVTIGRIELAVTGLLLLFWIPYFILAFS